MTTELHHLATDRRSQLSPVDNDGNISPAYRTERDVDLFSWHIEAWS